MCYLINLISFELFISFSCITLIVVYCNKLFSFVLCLFESLTISCTFRSHSLAELYRHFFNLGGLKSSIIFAYKVVPIFRKFWIKSNMLLGIIRSFFRASKLISKQAQLQRSLSMHLTPPIILTPPKIIS